ncbi:FAD-linked oxidase C-terminal domain-containing protein [Variovorax sp.]|uniref:FAD-binding oxidoreductase n=1 Tax=Variovorax sp. TaxID=1871043 RepID=UPI000C354F01|nr:FAD-linked oxidase C-terminal domain-containing protein [Variovorax sp.]MBS77719.1 FAD/FMN-containing dehydrogenase [Variovorax sp.]
MNDATLACIDDLRGWLGERLSTAPAVRDQHGRDTTFHPVMPPDAVAFPQNVAEVQRIVATCAARRVPLVAFGTGTSCEGHIAALRGGISLDTRGLDRIREVRAADMDATVEAGVTRKSLNAHLHGTGLQFPVDPGADASIGGMVSTRASGTNAMRYGTMRENVMALEVVLPDGELIRTGTRARKSAAGYDLTRLFVGAEGTLGIVTAATVRLHALPEHVAAATCAFGTLRAAVDTVIETLQAGVQLGRVELLDALQVEAVNRYTRLGMAVAPTLFFEFHGSEPEVAHQVKVVREIAASHGGQDFAWAHRPEDRSRLWQARHDIWWANKGLRPGAEGLPTDVCVPISELADQIEAAQQDVRAEGLIAPICGHVGDGNFHLCFMVDPSDAAEIARVKAAYARMIRRALAVGGTCTGEHGIGHGKVEFLREEAGGGLRVMQALRAALDPLGILNPGKVTGFF